MKGFFEGFSIEKEIKQLYFSMKEIYEAEDEFPHLAEQAKKSDSMLESSMKNPLSQDEREELEQLRFEKQTVNRNELKDNEHQCLRMPDAQELGRLKKEKAQLDKLLKAAVLIGHWVDTCKFRITKSQIQGILDNHFPDMYNKPTIITQLWDSLPNNAKNTGSGKAKEPMPDGIWSDVNTEIKK